jgi:PAS domain S-box-containing protein
MNDHEKSLEKLLKMEKAIDEMLEIHQQVIELRELESQRQRAMEVLQAAQEKYRAVVENIPQKLYIKDPDSYYIICNGKYAADLKIKPEEISGKTDFDFFPKELAEKYVADDKRIMATGQVENFEDEYVLEGQRFIVHTVKTPIIDANGERGGILGIFWDITEQKRNEEEMRKYRLHLEELVANRTAELQSVNNQWEREISERRRLEDQLQETAGMSRTLLENTGTAMVLIEEDMTISMANREFEKFSGYSREEVEGKKSLTEFVTHADLERIKEACLASETSEDAHPGHFEGRLVDKQGNIRDIRITAAGVSGSQRAVVSLLDITERKQVEESLRILGEQYEALVENANEAIFVMEDGHLKFGNPKIFEISGYTKEELSARPFTEFIHPDDREAFELLHRNQDLEKVSQAQAFRLIHKDGHIHWVENKGSLIHWQGKPAVLNFMTDITDRKHTEEELRSSIESFRVLVDDMEKILITLDRKGLEKGK